jgi:ATP-dependent Clp protease ATP-binding subunit ClpA
MNEYEYLFQYYTFFNNRIVILVRYVLFTLFLAILLFELNNLQTEKVIVMVIYLLFLANELFINLRINKVRPKKMISEATDPVDALFFRARAVFEKSTDGYALAHELLRYPENKLIADKLSGQFVLGKAEIDKNTLLAKAIELVKRVNGKYLSSVDLFVAYLVLSEPTTKLLETVELEEQDLINMYYWSRNTFKMDERNRQKEIRFYGEGSFDFFVYGWNTELKKYSRSLTSMVLSLKNPPSVMGRTKEFEMLITALSKPAANNVLLIGEPGTGKRSLVEYLSYASFTGEIPANLAHMQVFELLADRLLAGVENKGELEDRLLTVIAEVSHAGNIILFIQNIENIFGAGGFDFDLSGTLAEYLQSNSLTVIGSTTQGAYKTYIAKHESTSQFFTTIQLPEPEAQDALFMLFEKVGTLERQYGVDITYSAVKTLVELSSSYSPDRYLPGKAVTVLETIATGLNLKGKDRVISKEIIEAYLTSTTHILIGDPTAEEKNLLLHLEEELHKRVIRQETAITAVSSALRRVRSGLKSEHRPIAVFLFMGPTGVGKTETAKALAKIYFGSEDAMIRLDMSEYQTQDSIKKLLGEGVGEAYSEHAFTEQIAQNPFSLVLLDEFEKGHPQILTLFLQVFEDGRLTDNKGRTISFQNTIIIATSNAGSEFIREHVAEAAAPRFKQQLIEQLLQSRIFSPELLNRFDETIVFTPLEKEDLKQVTQLLLVKAFAPLAEKHITVTVDQKLRDKILTDAYDEQFGARNIRRYITDHVLEYVSKLILEDRLRKGMSVTLTVDTTGAISVL